MIWIFFSNASKTFQFEYKEIEKRIKTRFDLKILIDGYGFKRWLINDKSICLKVDFVNDMEFRFGIPNVKNGWVIDNVDNILINKITALMGRDEPKDIFDLVIIFKNHDFKWDEVIQAALQKASFLIDALIIRIKSFPVSLLYDLNTVNPVSIQDFQIELDEMIKEISLLQNHFHKK